MAQALMIPSTAMLDSYHQTSLLTRPEGKRLTKLEQEMANVLARTDISENQKLELFGTTLENFKRVRGEIVNNGLMLTPVTAPQNELTSEEVFKTLQNVIQEALGKGPASQTSNPPQASSSQTSKPPQASSSQTSKPPQAASSQQVFQTKKPALNNQATGLLKQLLRSSNVRQDPLTPKMILAGKKYSKDTFNEALSKITSNDDYNATDLELQNLTQQIYKAMVKSNQDMGPLKKHKFFQELVKNAQITPRLKKTAAKIAIGDTAQNRSGTPRTRKSPARKTKSLSQLTGNGIVNFHEWDNFYDFDLSDIEPDFD